MLKPQPPIWWCMDMGTLRGSENGGTKIVTECICRKLPNCEWDWFKPHLIYCFFHSTNPNRASLGEESDWMKWYPHNRMSTPKNRHQRHSYLCLVIAQVMWPWPLHEHGGPHQNWTILAPLSYSPRTVGKYISLLMPSKSGCFHPQLSWLTQAKRKQRRQRCQGLQRRQGCPCLAEMEMIVRENPRRKTQ